MSKRFGDRLKATRERSTKGRKGYLTCAILGQHIGVSAEMVSRWERGYRLEYGDQEPKPTRDQLIRTLAVLCEYNCINSQEEISDLLGTDYESLDETETRIVFRNFGYRRSQQVAKRAIVMAIILLVPVLIFPKGAQDVLQFVLGPRMLMAYSPEIVNHSNGWCSAWPTEITDEWYGAKLRFPSGVNVGDFDKAPYYIYFQGRWVGPAIAHPQGFDMERGVWVIETSQWWRALFPASLDVHSWRLDYTCSGP